MAHKGIPKLVAPCTVYYYVAIVPKLQDLVQLQHQVSQQNGHYLKSLFMLITMVQISASYFIPSLRYIS